VQLRPGSTGQPPIRLAARLIPVFTHLGLGLALGLFIPPFLVNWYSRAANLIGG